jgi:hypothetical protein
VKTLQKLDFVIDLIMSKLLPSSRTESLSNCLESLYQWTGRIIGLFSLVVLNACSNPENMHSNKSVGSNGEAILQHLSEDNEPPSNFENIIKPGSYKLSGPVKLENIDFTRFKIFRRKIDPNRISVIFISRDRPRQLIGAIAELKNDHLELKIDNKTFSIAANAKFASGIAFKQKDVEGEVLAIGEEETREVENLTPRSIGNLVNQQTMTPASNFSSGPPPRCSE